MRKRISFVMLAIIAVQYFIPVVGSASEISEYLSEANTANSEIENESEANSASSEFDSKVETSESESDVDSEDSSEIESREILDQPWADFNVNDYAHVEELENYVDTNFSKIWYSPEVIYSSGWQQIDSVTYDLRGQGDSIVGESFTLQDVNNTFDIKVTITDASTFANNGQEWLRVKRGRDVSDFPNQITIQGQGYNYVKYHVDTYYKDTTTAVNPSALTVHVFQDVDKQQYAGVMRDNDNIYFDYDFYSGQRADYDGFQLWRRLWRKLFCSNILRS